MSIPMENQKDTGEAASYYNEQPHPTYEQPQRQQNNYPQPPPNYGTNYGGDAQDFQGADGKTTFEQAFKLDKPKYNDRRCS